MAKQVQKFGDHVIEVKAEKAAPQESPDFLVALQNIFFKKLDVLAISREDDVKQAFKAAVKAAQA